MLTYLPPVDPAFHDDTCVAPIAEPRPEVAPHGASRPPTLTAAFVDNSATEDGPLIRSRAVATGVNRSQIDQVAKSAKSSQTVAVSCEQLDEEPEAANRFFQLGSPRHERASLIVTSNKPFRPLG
jgi:hypothetical protein